MTPLARYSGKVLASGFSQAVIRTDHYQLHASLSELRNPDHVAAVSPMASTQFVRAAAFAHVDRDLDRYVHTIWWFIRISSQ